MNQEQLYYSINRSHDDLEQLKKWKIAIKMLERELKRLKDLVFKEEREIHKSMSFQTMRSYRY